MVMQRSRRVNPYPFTWEIPLSGFLAVLLAMVAGVQVGRSLANLAAGAGWVFIGRAGLFTSLPGVLSGDGAAGLPGLARPARPGLVFAGVGVVEAAVLAVCVVGVVMVLRRWGPGRMQGMATRGEAEQLLGVARLRKNAHVIRPDLYGPPRTPRRARGRGGRS